MRWIGCNYATCKQGYVESSWNVGVIIFDWRSHVYNHCWFGVWRIVVKLGKRLSRAIPLRCGLDAAGCGKRIFGGAKERREASMDSISVALIPIVGVKISLIPQDSLQFGAGCALGISSKMSGEIAATLLVRAYRLKDRPAKPNISRHPPAFLKKAGRQGGLLLRIVQLPRRDWSVRDESTCGSKCSSARQYCSSYGAACDRLSAWSTPPSLTISNLVRHISKTAKACGCIIIIHQYNQKKQGKSLIIVVPLPIIAFLGEESSSRMDLGITRKGAGNSFKRQITLATHSFLWIIKVDLKFRCTLIHWMLHQGSGGVRETERTWRNFHITWMIMKIFMLLSTKSIQSSANFPRFWLGKMLRG